MAIYDQGLEKNPANFTALTPLSFLPKAAAVYPNRTAVIYGTRRLTWREFYVRTRRLASALAVRGVGRGTTVAVMLPNTPEMIELHFGPAMLGAVVNTLNNQTGQGGFLKSPRLDCRFSYFCLKSPASKWVLSKFVLERPYLYAIC